MAALALRMAEQGAPNSQPHCCLPRAHTLPPAGTIRAPHCWLGLACFPTVVAVANYEQSLGVRKGLEVLLPVPLPHRIRACSAGAAAQGGAGGRGAGSAGWWHPVAGGIRWLMPPAEMAAHCWHPVAGGTC